MVVLDTETTGVDPNTDEVIEVAAVRVRFGEIIGSYQALIRPTGAVGASQQVHRISDAVLQAEGRDPATVFQEFSDFIGDTPVSGHNVRFDLRMLQHNSARVGVQFRFGPHFDSLVYARRLLRQDSYRLSDLATALELPVDPTHRALDDVHTTVHLLAHLSQLGRVGMAVRQRLLAQFAGPFEKLRERLDAWAAHGERPGVLIHRILHEGGLLAYYRSRLEADRLANLEQLSARIARLDDPALTPIEASRHVLDGAALAREQDLLDEMEGVRIITIHQAKGLEFDTVCIPGLVDGKFPTWGAIRSEDLEEERRVFYVAITRAKKSLELSSYERDDRGPCTPSRFLDGLTLSGSAGSTRHSPQ
jgi:DNA helicase-2/ATP-dependent DNA helicase PcrA